MSYRLTLQFEVGRELIERLCSGDFFTKGARYLAIFKVLREAEGADGMAAF